MKMMKKVNMDSSVTCVDFFNAHSELNDAMEAVGTILGIMERATSLNDKDHNLNRAAAYVSALRCEALRATNELSEIVKMCNELTGQEETNE